MFCRCFSDLSPFIFFAVPPPPPPPHGKHAVRYSGVAGIDFRGDLLVGSYQRYTVKHGLPKAGLVRDTHPSATAAGADGGQPATTIALHIQIQGFSERVASGAII